MVNTITKGNKLEEKVFKLFKEELSQNRLFLIPDCCKIYRKKGYYSKDRQSKITVDISIEVFLPGAKEYSLLIIIECKNYNHSVPVDDIEEFHSKLLQIAGANIKGIVATTNSFQKSALTFSKSKGLGLIRILDNSNFKWILKRAVTGLVTYEEIEKSEDSIYDGLINENYPTNQIDFLSVISDKYSYSAQQFFDKLLRVDIENLGKEMAERMICEPDHKPSFVPFIKKEFIESLSLDILKNIKYKYGVVPIDTICEYVKSNNNIHIVFENSLGYDELGFEILGKIIFEPTTIFISKKANENKHREKFTIAHEIAHHILNHFQFMTQEYYAENDFENSDYNLIKVDDIKRIEWQANYFASNLLLPKDNIKYEFFKILEEEDIKDKGYGALFIDRQECNINHYYKVTNKLRDKFQVSRKAISLRLKELELLNDSTGMYA